TVHNVWVLGVVSGVMSGLVDTFTIAMTSISMYPVEDMTNADQWSDVEYMSNFMTNGAFWKITAYTTAVGGCLLCFANSCGLALMKMERMHVGWYFRNCTFKVLVGWLAGLGVLWAEVYVMM
ncbi:MAG: sodium:proton antiporter, partial [Prevotella sp.]|nr:sodium:proton antiporter [Prevotella sp.]